MRTCDLHLHFSIYIGKLRKQTCIYFSPMKIRIANILSDNISISKTSYDKTWYYENLFIGFIFTFSFSILSKSKTTSSFFIVEIPVENVNRYFHIYHCIKISIFPLKKSICDVYINRFNNTHREKLKCKKKNRTAVFSNMSLLSISYLYLQ